MERCEKLVTILVRQHRIVEPDARQAWNDPEDDVLNARLGRGGNGDSVTVAAQAGGDPKNVDLRHRGLRWKPARGGHRRFGHRHSLFAGSRSPSGPCVSIRRSRVR